MYYIPSVGVSSALVHIVLNANPFAFLIFVSVMMGPTEIPSQSSETIKIPTAHYEFGANFIDPKVYCWFAIHFYL